MSEYVHLDLKKTSITTAAIIFGPLITYAMVVGNELFMRNLIAALVITVLSIFILYALETRGKK